MSRRAVIVAVVLVAVALSIGAWWLWKRNELLRGVSVERARLLADPLLTEEQRAAALANLAAHEAGL